MTQEPQGERHVLSPEYGFVNGSLNLEEVLEAYSYADHVGEEKGDPEPLSSYLESFRMLCRTGFPTDMLADYSDLKRLDLGESTGNDFWVENEVVIRSIRMLTDKAYNASVDEIASTAAYFTEFFIDNPKLIRYGSPDGLYIQGVDADIHGEVHVKQKPGVLLYTDDGELQLSGSNPRLYVTLSSLPTEDQKLITAHLEFLYFGDNTLLEGNE
jgi:hypothetical protein